MTYTIQPNLTADERHAIESEYAPVELMQGFSRLLREVETYLTFFAIAITPVVLEV